MRSIITQHRVRGLCQESAERELVAHCAGEDEERGFVACEGREAGLEGDGGGVLAEDVVEEGCGADCREHGRGGGGDDVGAEVG